MKVTTWWWERWNVAFSHQNQILNPILCYFVDLQFWNRRAHWSFGGVTNGSICSYLRRIIYSICLNLIQCGIRGLNWICCQVVVFFLLQDFRVQRHMNLSNHVIIYAYDYICQQNIFSRHTCSHSEISWLMFLLYVKSACYASGERKIKM